MDKVFCRFSSRPGRNVVLYANNLLRKRHADTVLDITIAETVMSFLLQAKNSVHSDGNNKQIKHC